MSIDELLPLGLFAAVSALTPGLATTLATASGAHFGFRRSMPFLAGMSVGLSAMAVAAAAGLAGLLLAQPSLRLAVKAAGSAYLLWLAWRIGRAGTPRRPAGVARPTGFFAAMGVQLQNPKAWTMTLGAAASFSALAASPAELAAVLGLAFGLAAGTSLALWCTAGLVLARLLRTDRQWRLLNLAFALLLAVSIVQLWL